MKNKEVYEIYFKECPIKECSCYNRPCIASVHPRLYNVHKDAHEKYINKESDSMEGFTP